MKKLIFTLSVFLLGFLQVQAQNPYAALGIEEQVLHYDDTHEEVFGNDTFKTIGYAIYDRINGLTALFDLSDSLVAVQKIDPSKMARFLSVDPIAKSYPELTVYQFASNTPIQAIDLDGLEMVKNTEAKQIRLSVVILNSSVSVNNRADRDQYLNDLKTTLVSDFEKTFSGESATGDAWIAKVDNVTIVNTILENDKTHDKAKGELRDKATDDKIMKLTENTIVFNLYDKKIKYNKDGSVNFSGAEAPRNSPNTAHVAVVAATIDKNELRSNSLSLISRNMLHELGHLGNLGHPWDIVDPIAPDMRQSKPYNSNIDSSPSKIKQNIMNSSENPKTSLRLDSGKEMTKHQRQIVVDALDETKN